MVFPEARLLAAMLTACLLGSPVRRSLATRQAALGAGAGFALMADGRTDGETGQRTLACSGQAPV